MPSFPTQMRMSEFHRSLVTEPLLVGAMQDGQDKLMMAGSIMPKHHLKIRQSDLSCMVDSRMPFSNFVVALARSALVITGEITGFSLYKRRLQSEPTIPEVQYLRTVTYVNTTVSKL